MGDESNYKKRKGGSAATGLRTMKDYEGGGQQAAAVKRKKCGKDRNRRRSRGSRTLPGQEKGRRGGIAERALIPRDATGPAQA